MPEPQQVPNSPIPGTRLRPRLRLTPWGHVGGDPSMAEGWLAHQQRIQDFVDEGDVFTAVKWAGSSHGAELLSQLWEQLTPEELGPALGEVWVMCHAPLAMLSS